MWMKDGLKCRRAVLMEEMRAGDPSAKLMVMCIMSFIRGPGRTGPEGRGRGGRGLLRCTLVVVHGRTRETTGGRSFNRKQPYKAYALGLLGGIG